MHSYLAWDKMWNRLRQNWQINIECKIKWFNKTIHLGFDTNKRKFLVFEYICRPRNLIDYFMLCYVSNKFFFHFTTTASRNVKKKCTSNLELLWDILLYISKEMVYTLLLLLVKNWHVALVFKYKCLFMFDL